MMHRDHVPTSKITMHKKNAFSHRAHNWLHDFSFRSRVIPMRSDFPIGFVILLQAHQPLNATPAAVWGIRQL